MVVNDRPLSGVFPPELNGFQRVIMSKFNPLRVRNFLGFCNDIRSARKQLSKSLQKSHII